MREFKVGKCNAQKKLILKHHIIEASFGLGYAKYGSGNPSNAGPSG